MNALSPRVPLRETGGIFPNGDPIGSNLSLDSGENAFGNLYLNSLCKVELWSPNLITFCFVGSELTGFVAKKR